MGKMYQIIVHYTIIYKRRLTIAKRLSIMRLCKEIVAKTGMQPQVDKTQLYVGGFTLDFIVKLLQCHEGIRKIYLIRKRVLL